MTIEELRTHRHHALNTALSAAMSRPDDVSADQMSRYLLYGLDHKLLSYHEATAFAYRLFGAENITTVRFAARQIVADDGKFWRQLWNRGSDRVRPWLLTAAVDFTSDVAYEALDIEALTLQNSELHALAKFLQSWNAGPPRQKNDIPIQRQTLMEVSLPFRNMKASAVVTGFSGTGKSATAARLQQLDLRVVDLDALAVHDGDQGLARLFAHQGAGQARKVILDSGLRHWMQKSRCEVIVCGGAITSSPEGRCAITASTGPVVALLASTHSVTTRLERDMGHALHKFCATPYSCLQVRRIQRLREDHYYQADVELGTDRLNVAEVTKIISGMVT